MRNCNSNSRNGRRCSDSSATAEAVAEAAVVVVGTASLNVSNNRTGNSKRINSTAGEEDLCGIVTATAVMVESVMIVVQQQK